MVLVRGATVLLQRRRGRCLCGGRAKDPMTKKQMKKDVTHVGVVEVDAPVASGSGGNEAVP